MKFLTVVALMIVASAANAATLYVNCGAKVGLTSIGAALKALQSFESQRPATINVSGACNENVVIQNLDRLTLNAAPGASINDVSAGNLDTVQVANSNGVTINNFTINGGVSGISCVLGSLCFVNGITAQGAGFAGVAAGALSRVFVSGGTFQNNYFGLEVVNGGGAWAFGVLIQHNSAGGVELRTQAVLNTDATITGNSGSGVFATHNATLNCNGCQVTGNGILGVILRRNSTARFAGGPVITGNTGGGVLLSEESSAYFAGPATVTGNPGGLDVACDVSATTARNATSNIGGGTTNCAEPVGP
jgi:hypothetical protein